MADSTEGARGLRPLRAVLAAGATGFGVMAAELTAVRLLAPHFGDSAYVWTNVIGVILAAMALGATLGGRLSARDGAERWPFRLLLAGGLLLVVAPFSTGWLGALLLPADLPLDAAMPVLIRGSLVATALVFAPPLLLLAAVSPLLIVLLARGGTSLGRAAGDVAASGTVGSLVGTFLATHWLVPTLGCRLALLVAAAVMLLAALLVAPGRGRGAAAVALLVTGASTLLHGGPLRPTAAGVELVAERETPYQFLQVHRTREHGRSRTTLVINEGLDSFHSLDLEGSPFTGGAYYDWHGVAPLLAADGGGLDGLKALSIGDAAGTLRQVYGALYPGMTVDAVDIDAETMALGDAHFGDGKAAGRRFAIDGRQFLAHAEDRWNVIHVDAYAHQVYVPAHLASREFFTQAHARLLDGGVLACNVGALQLDDAVLQAVAATVADVFDEVRVFLIPSSRNALLVARRGAPLRPEILEQALDRPFGLADADLLHWRDVLRRTAEPANWHALAEAAPVLCDDQPLLDELLFDSYVQHADPRQVVAASGQRGRTDAEQEAFEASQRGAWRATLQVVAESAAATPFLRLQAGDARWNLRHLHSAALEYRAGLQLSPDAKLRNKLEQRLADLQEQLGPIEAADTAATRNGWLAGAIVALGAALALLLRRV